MFPTGFVDVAGHVGSAAVFACPADEAIHSISGLSEGEAPAQSTYQWVLSENADTLNPQTEMITCSEHDHVAFVDGSVRAR